MRVENTITVLGPDGGPLAGARVMTRQRPSGRDATVFASETGATLGSNPATTDAAGRVTQWLDRTASRYASTITHPDLTTYVEQWDAAPDFLTGLHRDRPTASTDLDGLRYDATDTGMTWLCTAGAWSLINVRPIVVTALPASPSDGQEIIYKGTGAPSTGWRLRYNAGSASAHKWEAVGDLVPTVIDESVSPRTTASVTAYPGSAVSGAPQYQTPLAGEWDVEVTGVASMGAAGDGRATIFVANTLLRGGEGVGCLHAASVAQSISARRTTGSVAARTVIDVRYKTTVATSGNFFQVTLEIRPLRVG